MPTTDASLKPQIVPNVPSAFEKVRMQKTNYYDKSARPLAQLQPGDTVRIRKDKFTKSGVITSEADTPSLYMVQIGSGTYRRNRKHLRPSHLPVAQPVVQTSLNEWPHHPFHLLEVSIRLDRKHHLSLCLASQSNHNRLNRHPSLPQHP